MMQINGKTFYRISDAENEFGYTKGTLANYISTGIVDAERMEDGEWLITEVGWVQLKRRKKAIMHDRVPPLVTMDAPQQTPVEEKKRADPEIDKTHGSNGQSVHFTSEHHQKILSKVRNLAGDLGVSIKEMTVCLIEKGLESESLKKDLQELDDIDKKRMDLLKRMRVKI